LRYLLRRRITRYVIFSRWTYALLVLQDKWMKSEACMADIPLKVALDSLDSRSFSYHLYSVWLFTFSDLKTIVFPKIAFGISTALSGPVLMVNPLPSSLIICRLPLVAFWIWINLLPFAINNQRQPKAIEEDKLNKPWRSMPSKRLTPEEAKILMLIAYPAALVLSVYLGATEPSVMLIFFGWVYNELGGADKSPIIRNLINGIGYLSFASGATIVASGHLLLNEMAYSWLLIIGAVVVTTVQLQDMSDQEGDSARGRRTVPLVLGDGPARWTIAVPVMLWSFICPFFWSFAAVGFVLPVAFGTIVSSRVLLVRTLPGDKLTFKVWNVWMMVLYLMPLLKRWIGW